MPLALRLLPVMLAGALLGSLVNWAAYRLAWNRRRISPWGPAPEGADPRTWADRLPLVGWWLLRRESRLHGAGFWLRPMVVELLMAAGLAALYWWEVDRQGLISGQLDVFAAAYRIGPPGGVPPWPLHLTFLNHALLVTLMAAASLIDIDERLIPDEVTAPGTMLGLLLAALVPMSLLPQAAARFQAPTAGIEINAPAGDAPALYLEPTTLAAPNDMPPVLQGGAGLAVGVACWLFWCWATAPVVWHGRRGAGIGLRIACRQFGRHLRRGVPLLVAALGVGGVVAVYAAGGPAWAGLLSAVAGMVASGLVVWAVRIVGSAALGREAMGFGDVTLMMMIGAFIGWQAGVVAFFVAPFAGLVVGVLQLVINRDNAIPYGPFLCLGTLAVVVGWSEVWLAVRDFYAVWWLIPAVFAVVFPLLGAMLLVWRGVKALFVSGQ